MGGKSVSRFFEGAAFFQVIPAENGVGGNHCHVNQVEAENQIDAATHVFGNGAADVSGYHEKGEEKTFSGGIFRADGFEDGKRPACAKTDQHQAFVELRIGEHIIVL